MGDNAHLSRIAERLAERGKLSGLMSCEEAGPLQLILLSLVAQASSESSDRDEELEEIMVRHYVLLLYLLHALYHTSSAVLWFFRVFGSLT